MGSICKTLIIMMVLSLTTTAFAEELTAAKKADIEKLLNITGSLKIASLFGSAVTSQMFASLKQSRPDIPGKAIEIISDETNKVINENINNLVVPMVGIYGDNLSHDEIRGLIAFYETPLGRKTVEVMPVMAREGMKVGQKWGQELAPQLIKRIEERLKKEKIITEKGK